MPPDVGQSGFWKLTVNTHCLLPLGKGSLKTSHLGEFCSRLVVIQGENPKQISQIHKASHLTLSNAFDKSKFIITNGMLASAVSSNNKLATNKRSSIQSDLPLKPVSENASMRSEKIYAIGRKSDGWLSRFFLRTSQKVVTLYCKNKDMRAQQHVVK